MVFTQQLTGLIGAASATLPSRPRRCHVQCRHQCPCRGRWTCGDAGARLRCRRPSADGGGPLFMVKDDTLTAVSPRSRSTSDRQDQGPALADEARTCVSLWYTCYAILGLPLGRLSEASLRLCEALSCV